MKFFISQPMKDLTDEDITLTRKYIEEYLKMHYDKVEIIDSYFGQNWAPEEVKRPSVYSLGKSLELLADADICVFANGWEQARGCRLERNVCLSYDIPILDLDKKVRR